MKFELKEKHMAVLAVLILGLLLLPLLRLACYSTPWYDDYNFMYYARIFKIQFDRSYIYGAYRTMLQEWYAWQGTYSTTFLTALNPFLWGEEFQKIGVMSVIIIFTISAFMLAYMMLRMVLDAGKSESCVVASVVVASCIGMVYTSQQGLYWYNAAVHYTLMPAVGFLMIVAMLKILYSKTKAQACIYMLLATILGVICAGSNYVTILQMLIVLLTIFVLAAICKREHILFLLLPMVGYGIGFWKNISAPGNQVRGSAYQGDGVFEAVFHSFVAAGKHFYELSGMMMFVMLLLLVPVIWGMVKKSTFSFRYPVLVTLYSICLYATGFTSSRFAMGTDGISRTWVTIQYTLKILLFINEIYWLGYLSKKKEFPIKNDVRYYCLMAVIAVGVFLGSPNKVGDYAPYGAYYYIHSGEAYNFYQEYLERVECLKSEEKNVVLEPYHFQPWMLCPGDLSSDAGTAQNISLARWYGKDSVVVKQP